MNIISINQLIKNVLTAPMLFPTNNIPLNCEHHYLKILLFSLIYYNHSEHLNKVFIITGNLWH